MLFWKSLLCLLLSFCICILLFFSIRQYINLLPLDSVTLTKITTAFQSISTLALPPILSLFLLKTKPFHTLLLAKSPPLKHILYAIFLIPVSQPLIEFLSFINHNLPIPEALLTYQREISQTVEKLLKTGTLQAFILNLLVLAFVPAITEEFFFRGYLQQSLETILSPHFAIIILSLVFSSIHLQLSLFLPRLFMGLVLGYTFYWTKNLWIPIIAHFTNNALVVSLFYIKEISQQKVLDIIEPSSRPSLTSLLLSCGATTIVLYYFYRNSTQQNTHFTKEITK